MCIFWLYVTLTVLLDTKLLSSTPIYSLYIHLVARVDTICGKKLFTAFSWFKYLRLESHPTRSRYSLQMLATSRKRDIKDQNQTIAPPAQNKNKIIFAHLPSELLLVQHYLSSKRIYNLRPRRQTACLRCVNKVQNYKNDTVTATVS